MNILILQNSGNHSRPKLASFQAAFRSLGHACGHIELESIASAANDGSLAAVLDAIRSQVRHGIFEAGVNFKVFEITACRTLCLTNYREQLEDLFDLDREIVVYRSHEELLDKLDFYLRHDAERERIAAAGYRRTRAHHTFENLARAVVDLLELAPTFVPREPVGV